MAREQYNIVLLQESSIDQQIELYKQAFEINDSVEELKNFWIKKHYKNPLGKSLIFGIFIDDTLAGMNVYLPCIYQYQGNDILCLQSCESGVNPEYQGRGIWGSIVRYAVDYITKNTSYEIIIGFPNYRNSYPGFVKMKWETIASMDNYIMINNPRKFLSAICNKPILRIFSPILSLQKMMWKCINITDGIIIKEGNEDSFTLPQFKDNISLKPDAEWLKWKFDYKEERFLTVSCKGTIIASCAFFIDKFCEENIIRLDKIIYYDSCKISYKKVLAKIVGYLATAYPDTIFIRTWTQKKSIFENDFSKLFFIKSSHPNPFIIKRVSNNKIDAKWNLSFLDLD